MRNTTSRFTDCGETNSRQRSKSSHPSLGSKALAGLQHGSRAGLRLAFGALALTTLATFAGWSDSATAAEPSGEILIGLVTKTEVNPYFVKLRQAATAE